MWLKIGMVETGKSVTKLGTATGKLSRNKCALHSLFYGAMHDTHY
jgi:hypothetical protein